MIDPSQIKITTEMLWREALLFAAIDAVLLSLLAWLVKPYRFRQIRWPLVALTAAFWFLLWTWAVAYYWDPVYHYFFPGWSRGLLPVLQSLLTAGAALLSWHLARRFPGSPVVGYCFLGGLWGLLTHAWAVSRGLVSRSPMLAGAAPAAAIIVAFFEFMLYWCLILGLAALGHRIWLWLKNNYPNIRPQTL